LDHVAVTNPDKKVGVDIVKKALQSPVRQIAENSGVDGSIIVGKLQDSTDSAWGYDAQKGEFTDLIKAGIVDPTKVVRIALQDAASIRRPPDHDRGDDRREAREESPPMPGGGMGGMGDMDF
jgi:chaperonin GroEL